MDNCVFCKIIKGEIPSYKVYEDPDFLSFLTIEPLSDAHVLIIPKKHIEWMQDAPDEVVAGIFVVAKKIMKAMKKAYSPDYVQVSVSGEEVPHFHVHLFNRYGNDGFMSWPTKKLVHEEAPDVVKRITANLT